MTWSYHGIFGFSSKTTTLRTVIRTSKASWLIVIGLGLFASEVAAESKAPIYIYQKRGKDIFVDSIDKVPPEYRSAMRVLNAPGAPDATPPAPEVNTSEATLKAQEAELLQHPACRDSLGKAKKETWQLIWDEHGHLIVVGLTILLLLLSAPSMLAMMPAGQWIRFLVIALPGLVMLGIFTHIVRESQTMLADLKHGSSVCSLPPWQGGSKEELGARSKLVKNLRAYIENVEKRRQAHIERALGTHDKQPE